MPVAKKYEMLGDRDATKLKLELEGGEKHRENSKKDSSGTETIATKTDDKEQDGEKKDDEEMDISQLTTTGEESTAEDVVTDQSMKEDNAANAESAGIKDNQTAYDPNVAIGNAYCNISLINHILFYVHIFISNWKINYFRNVFVFKINDLTFFK